MPSTKSRSGGSARRANLKPFTREHFQHWSSLLVLDTGGRWEVEDFQLSLAEDVFSGVREVWYVLPEGNAKTMLMAAIALYGADHSESPWTVHEPPAELLHSGPAHRLLDGRIESASANVVLGGGVGLPRKARMGIDKVVAGGCQSDRGILQPHSHDACAACAQAPRAPQGGRRCRADRRHRSARSSVRQRRIPLARSPPAEQRQRPLGARQSPHARERCRRQCR